jgi:uncharacterized cupredoxin-like copper-binding protein
MIPRRTIFKLFALSVLTAPVMGAQPPGPIVIPIELMEFRFAPSTVNLQSHTSYLLRLTNTGSSEHDLAAPKFFMAIAISADSIKRVHEGRVVLRAGETVDIEVTTGDAGAFPMRCTYFGHALMGMTGHLEVHGGVRTK